MATIRILNRRRRNSPAGFTSCTTPVCLITRYSCIFMLTALVTFWNVLYCTPLPILMFCGSQLPANMPVTWNKKMRKTAGYCVTGQERAGGRRYARIELSEKVCDSAGMTLTKLLNCCRMYARQHLLMLDLVPRSPQGHTHSWDVPRRHLAHQRSEGRSRERLEAARSKSDIGASRAADGDPLPQLWHQIQVPVSVHPLQECVRSHHDCIESLHLFTGTHFLFLLCSVFHHYSPPGLDVIQSHWTLRGLRAPSAWDSWFCWRPPSPVPPHLLPPLWKRTTGARDRSWRDKATQTWCVSSAQTLPPSLNSLKYELQTRVKHLR